ncbi:lytic transglycosylase domain-containing protein [Mucilaginibacter sp. dw_454]|uniref:lytic transglycosylase domain-containing protein n=1 Tax=Mucilaginibacter sp. dw_454 TaxID=2720079 RepID=UPI001BD40078|nr:lytic transglycosylase domain-containing protein [Mucilaginibacter sp. dw_454]
MKMIKKHFITCSVILVMAVILKLNIYGVAFVKTATAPAPKSTRFISYVNYDADAKTDYSFANETLPANTKVYRKMQYSLTKHNYRNIQSHILQIKAGKIFPVIEPILLAYGIPLDFKYLPLVESGLKEGTSAKGAAGIWQFMPGTARTYGLKVGHGVDERLNLRKATIAACRYIRDLHNEFKNWTLTAAAYNNGSIKLAKAMRSQSEGNYFRMKLNRETGNYVYNLIAMKAVIDHPGQYGYNKYIAYVPPKDFIAYN